MSIFDRNFETGAETAPAMTMQDVFDLASNSEKPDEAKAVKRLSEFHGQPLWLLPADLTEFDKTFPLAKLPHHVPGRERGFWRTRSAYIRWRRKVRCQIQHATGAYDAKRERGERKDGWTALVDLLGTLAKNKGPVHAAEFGAVKALADRARETGVEPASFVDGGIERLVEGAPTAAIRDKVFRALAVLDHYSCIRSVAALLPGKLDIEAVRRRFENTLPDRVTGWIDELVEVARLKPGSWNETTQSHSARVKDGTADMYRSALRSYAWTASLQRSGAFDLDARLNLEEMFSEEVFGKVLAHWVDTSDAPDGLTARSARTYVSNCMTVAGRNGFDVSHMGKAMKHSTFLEEGKEAGEQMSEKSIQFCRPLVNDLAQRKLFLTQHLHYREIAEDLIATDKVICGERLNKIRRFGTCAAFAAMEIVGAPMRVSNAMQRKHRGPNADLLLPTDKDTHYLAIVPAKERKGRQTEALRIKIQKNKFEGPQTLDWYLETIRPLFPFGNAVWCESKEDEPLDRIRFGLKKDGKRQAESHHFFVSPTSAKPMAKSLFYDWLVPVSESIGLPMTPHNMRHGIASILMARSLQNAPKIAALLGNTPAIVLKYYAWINREAVIEDAQSELFSELMA